MPRNDDLLEQLVQHLIKRVDEISTSIPDKLDKKVDELESKVCGEVRYLRKEVADRVNNLEDKISQQDLRLNKVEHRWTTLMFFVSFGSAILASATGWIGSLFGIK
jgi:hypothetical protein